MAFQKTNSKSFYQLLITTVKDAHPEFRSMAENFILEERLTDQREDSYESHIAAPASVGDWQRRHNRYIDEKINVRSEMPETFTEHNQPNLLSNIEKDQYLVRLENVTDLRKSLDLVDNQLIDYLNEFIKNLENKAAHDISARAIVEKTLADWNMTRDLRPIFVGFWDEVADLFSDVEGKKPKTPD